MAKTPENLHSRPPMDRMLQIHELLQRAKYPNCQTLARMIEVSGRTIKRDIDFMRDRLRLPIDYDPKRLGFYYTKKVEQFPGLPMNESEVFALLVAGKAIEHYHGTPFEAPLKSAYGTLLRQLSGGSDYYLQGLDQALSFRPFAPQDADLASFETVNKAVKERRVLRFEYRKLGDEKGGTRRIRPYHIACVDQTWYVFGHDLERKAIRTFSLGRLSSPSLEKATFDKPKDFDIAKHLAGSFGVFKGSDDFEVVIDFDRWGGDLIRGRRWHRSQQMMELPGGRIRLSLRLDNIEEVERWVLSWGIHATVIRPKRLAKRLMDVGGFLQEAYRENAAEA